MAYYLRQVKANYPVELWNELRRDYPNMLFGIPTDGRCIEWDEIDTATPPLFGSTAVDKVTWIYGGLDACAELVAEERRQGVKSDCLLRHKQQHLLLLLHAAKCQNKGVQCQVQRCAEVKRLREHLAGCNDQCCRVPLCTISQRVLNHHTKCVDARCPICGPVHHAIQRNHQHHKQALKQRSQQPQSVIFERLGFNGGWQTDNDVGERRKMIIKM